MQQPDYTSAPYYHYAPSPNPNPTPPPPPQSSYASAPPYNYPPHPQFPQNPDPIPSSNPNPNFPQFTPTPPQTPQFDHQIGYQPPPQPDPYYQHFNSNQTAPSYSQFGPSEADYAKFEQLGISQADSGSTRFDSHQTAPGYPQVGPYENNNPKFNQFGSARVDSGSSRFDYGSNQGGYGDDIYGYQGNKPDHPQLGSYEASCPKFDHFASNLGSTQGNKPDYPQLGPYEGNNAKFNHYGSSRVDLGSTQFDSGYGDGVYAYQGSKTEPYGARGTGSKSWGADSGSTRFDSGPSFDDFGRPIGKGPPARPAAKVVRAVPKAESDEDVKGGVQKFRVKLLAETGGQTTMDVLCQIGLDGIRMLDPTTSRTLRIYPLETVTRYEILDSTIFAFWAKTPVDIEPRRIRLKSTSYTSGTILDIVTAATIQIKEIGGRSSRPSESSYKPVEQSAEKKKGLGDWMNIMKPGNEEKDHWLPDEAVSKCTSCGTDFNAFVRRHHCRNCGDIFCNKCTQGRTALTAEENAQPVRVCDRCLAEVTHRLNIAKETAHRSTAGVQSHEDLAKKLQEEMERNRRSSSGSRSDGSGKRMKEVACPTCTVHLQVQVPSSGSETIECGVCQHPFLVSAR